MSNGQLVSFGLDIRLALNGQQTIGHVSLVVINGTTSMVPYI